MILIEKIRISPDTKKLEIVVSTNFDRRITSLKVKTILQYQDNSDDWTTLGEYTDLSSLIIGQSNSEAIYVDFGEHGLPYNSMYFIQVADNVALGDEDISTVHTTVASLDSFYVCLVDKVLKLRNKCDTCLYDVEILYFLLEGVKNAIMLGRYQEAIEFWAELEMICDVNCKTCCEDTTNSLASGIGVWVLNNNFITQ